MTGGVYDSKEGFPEPHVGGPGSGRPKKSSFDKLVKQTVRMPAYMWEYCKLRGRGENPAEYIRRLVQQDLELFPSGQEKTLNVGQKNTDNIVINDTEVPNV